MRPCPITRELGSPTISTKDGDCHKDFVNKHTVTVQYVVFIPCIQRLMSEQCAKSCRLGAPLARP